MSMGARPTGIFISYRRDDTQGYVGHLFADLKREFGEDSVFMDVAGIEFGRDFRRVLDDNVANCGVLLAVIGPHWMSERLEDASDFVRLEIAAALVREIPVVPVLVQGAKLPEKDLLPADLKDLVFRHAIVLSHEKWDSDIKLLVRALNRHVRPPRTRLFRRAGIALAAVAVLGAFLISHFHPGRSAVPSRSNPPVLPTPNASSSPAPDRSNVPASSLAGGRGSTKATKINPNPAGPKPGTPIAGANSAPASALRPKEKTGDRCLNGTWFMYSNLEPNKEKNLEAGWQVSESADALTGLLHNSVAKFKLEKSESGWTGEVDWGDGNLWHNVVMESAEGCSKIVTNKGYFFVH